MEYYIKKPDHFENYDDWPFFCRQNEGTVRRNTGYLIFGSAFKSLVKISKHKILSLLSRFGNSGQKRFQKAVIGYRQTLRTTTTQFYLLNSSGQRVIKKITYHNCSVVFLIKLYCADS
jgi:hypothetical protein